MTNQQPQQQYEIGMVGLGVMGRNFVLNMAGHGFTVAGYDKDQAQVEALRQESKERDVRGVEDIQEFAGPTRGHSWPALVPSGIGGTPQMRKLTTRQNLPLGRILGTLRKRE